MVPEAGQAFGPEGVLDHMRYQRAVAAQAPTKVRGFRDPSAPPIVASPVMASRAAFVPGVPQATSGPSSLVIVGVVAGIAAVGTIAYFALRSKS